MGKQEKIKHVLERAHYRELDPCKSLAIDLGLQVDDIHAMLADGDGRPRLDRIDILERSITELSAEKDGKRLIEFIDPAAFDGGLVDIEELRDRIRNPLKPAYI